MNIKDLSNHLNFQSYRANLFIVLLYIIHIIILFIIDYYIQYNISGNNLTELQNFYVYICIIYKYNQYYTFVNAQKRYCSYKNKRHETSYYGFRIGYIPSLIRSHRQTLAPYQHQHLLLMPHQRIINL